jgi:hypothetical protein
MVERIHEQRAQTRFQQLPEEVEELLGRWATCAECPALLDDTRRRMVVRAP